MWSLSVFSLLLTPLLSLAANNNGSSASSYAVKTPPLTTDFTYTVGTDPWYMYPRPQLTRDRWQSLNGVWSYKNASGGATDIYNVPTGDLGNAVLVPSCLESGLSGVMAENGTAMYSWFQTTFDIPSAWKGDDVLINFGAVDFEATIFINGQNASFHRGGYIRFYADISQYVNIGQTNEIVVFVHDPTDLGDTNNPVGKQTNTPTHIFYTPCSGIWKEVFIEPVPKQTFIERVDVTGDMNGLVNMTVLTSDHSYSDVKISVFDGKSSTAVKTASGTTDQPFTFTVDNPSLWTPDTPSLYNITVTVGQDTVVTYTGFRTLSKGMVNGVQRAMLNGEVLFAFGTLDQGFWPDGLYTPPSYEAMTFDLQVLKSLGFNMLRKHIKVETDLFYYACDTMGLLLIQDMPALGVNNKVAVPNATQQAEFERQLFDMIETHKSFPSIYTWVIYNEGWGQLPSAPELYLTPAVRSIDPTRLIDSVTGWNDHGAGDYSDNHHYSEPQCGAPFYSTPSSPYDPSRIAIQGEFGGIGNNVSIDHLWSVQEAVNTINQTYELDADIPTWNFRAHTILTDLRIQTDMYACSGGVWTQTTDVEGEVNGLLTYDRRILRCNQTQWQSDIAGLYSAAAARAGSSAPNASSPTTMTMTLTPAVQSLLSSAAQYSSPTPTGTLDETRSVQAPTPVATQAAPRGLKERGMGWKGVGANHLAV